jgi:hypothetical protein
MLLALAVHPGEVAHAQAQPAITRAACLGFTMDVTQGPNAGRSWTGDLLMDVDAAGFFDATLIPENPLARLLLALPEGPPGVAFRASATCFGTGQVYGTMVTWTLYCGGDRLTGFGHIDPLAPPQDAGGLPTGGELRGMFVGPTSSDFGFFHGSRYPPYIRTISGDRSLSYSVPPELLPAPWTPPEFAFAADTGSGARGAMAPVAWRRDSA